MTRLEATISSRVSTKDIPGIAAPGSTPATTVLNPTPVLAGVTGIKRGQYMPARLMGSGVGIATVPLIAVFLGAFSSGGDLFGHKRLFVRGFVGTANRPEETARR